MKQKKIEIPGIGEVLLEHSPRARRMNLSLRPFRGIRVAVPPGVSFGAAESFARSQSSWMMARLPRLRIAEETAANQCRKTPIPQTADPRMAKKRIIDRLAVLSAQYGLAYNRVSVRNQKTRWGSCSSKKNINLNINLIWLPEKLMDYAILHELAHTKLMHHGPAFWDFMEKLVPCALLLDRELRRYSPISFMQEAHNQAPDRSGIHDKGE